MAPLPFIGRLHPYEYLALFLSLAILFLETIARTITLFLPTPIIRYFYRLSRRAFNTLSSPYSRRARNHKKNVTSPIAQAGDFGELCELYGYATEEHIVQTGDGYLLGLHRLPWRRGEEDLRVNTGPDSLEKKVVYLHHGLMMNSEVWVCLTESERCLPFVLVEQGYDVWLGNNRGNKYSKKSLHYTPTEVPFWNFSMDQFAFHDIPDSIDYILKTTQQESLSYVGFSQGTAQAFATLSIHPVLNQKVDVFIALAPAMAPPGLASGIVSSLVKTNPEILYLAFGRRALLASTTMWQALLYPGIFTFVIDKSLSFLFGWKAQNISPHQKLAAYPHLFSFTSVKSVVHWFQIIRHGTFQMFDDEVSAPLASGNSSKFYKVAKFPTRNIRTPIVLVYGGSDSLVDINIMLRELPKHTIAKCIPKYEHLDFLWAHDVHRLVFPHVLDALESFARSGETKQKAIGWKRIEQSIFDRASLASTTAMSSTESLLPPALAEDVPEQTLLDGIKDSKDALDIADQISLLDETDDEARDSGSAPENFAVSPDPRSRLPGGGGRTIAEPRLVRSSTATSPEASSSSSKRKTSSRQNRIKSPKLKAHGRPLSPDETLLGSPESTIRATVPTSSQPGWWSSTTTGESSPYGSKESLLEVAPVKRNRT